MAVLMAKQGYVAVPMTVTDRDGHFTVPCRVGSESFRMLVDTGARSTSIDVAIIKRLKLPLGEEVKVLGIGGRASEHEVVLPNGMQVGTFDTQGMIRGDMRIHAGDYSQLSNLMVTNKGVPIGGILGLAALERCSAVIDCSSKTLYLRSPLSKIWPKIEGAWTAVGKKEAGQAVAIDPKVPPRVEFKDRQVTVTDGKVSTHGIHVIQGPDCLILAMYTPGDELRESMEYKAIWLLKVAGDKLTLGVGVDPKSLDGLLSEGVSKVHTGPGGATVLLECVRDKR